MCLGCLWQVRTWAGPERFHAAVVNPALRPVLLDEWLQSLSPDDDTE